MQRLKFLVLLLAFYTVILPDASAQIDASLKGRVTGYSGRFGETYNALGYEPMLTIKPTAKPWAGGLSYSENILTYDADSELKGKFDLAQVHLGAKGSVGKYVHPFAYALLGLRFMSFDNDAVNSEEGPLFTSVSFGYGTRAGLQIGGGNWRFEGSIEYMTGTNMRYLTPESFRKATETGRSYHDFTHRSLATGFTVAAGIAYVINWNTVTIE